MQISGETRILALIGDPVSQARTPAMANQFLMQSGDFGRFVLVPMHVAPSDLQDVMKGLRAMQNFAGAVVTMPHKKSMVALVDELTPEARLVGAVNVIRREAQGTLVGTVLDGEGFVGGLAAAGHTVKGKTCVLVGAGGAASAIAFALAKHGCERLFLLNRTSAKAESLAARLRHSFPDLSVSTAMPLSEEVDITINGTSMGMKPGDELPLPEVLIDRSRLVADCVLAPEISPLLDLARKKGKVIHTGVPMLAAQMKRMLTFMGVE